MEAGKVYGQSSSIFLFHAEVLNIPRPHAERIDFFCTCCHDGVPTGQSTMTVACTNCQRLPDSQMIHQQKEGLLPLSWTSQCQVA